MYIFSYHSYPTLESPVLVQYTKMFLALSYGKKGTVMPAEQYSSVLTQAPPKRGQLEKTSGENRELQAQKCRHRHLCSTH